MNDVLERQDGGSFHLEPDVDVVYLETCGRDFEYDYIINERNDRDHAFARVIVGIKSEIRLSALYCTSRLYPPEISSSIVGGAIPSEFIPSAIRGINEAVAEGPVTGGPVVGISIDLRDGAHHDVSSDSDSFQTAAKRAVYGAMLEAGAVVLEPLLEVAIETSKQHLGHVISSIESCRGVLTSTSNGDSKVTASAKCPASKMAEIHNALQAHSIRLDQTSLIEKTYRVVEGEELEKLKKIIRAKRKVSRLAFEISDSSRPGKELEGTKIIKQFEVPRFLKLKADVIRFAHSIYCEILPAQLRPRSKVDDHLLEEWLQSHGEWLATDGQHGTRLKMYGKNLQGWDVSGRVLDRCVLRDCDLRGARFAGVKIKKPDAGDGSREESSVASIRGVDFSYSRLERAVFGTTREHERVNARTANMTGARFVGCSGVFGAEGAYFGRELIFDPTEPPIVQRWLPGSSFGDFPSWNLISTFQNLRLLAVSNTLAIILVFYAAIANIYNASLISVQSAVQSDADPDSLSKLVLAIPQIPTPSHFGYLLIVVVFLTVTNIIYHYLCPQSVGSQMVISSYSSSSNDVFQTLSARYHGLIGRWFCFVALSACCSYIVYYLLQRVSEAIDTYLPTQ